MRQEELVGKRVLVKLGALPIETQEQRVAKPVFERFSIVEVVGYMLGVPYQVIIDSKSLGWGDWALSHADIITKKAETYWLVNLDNIVEILK